MFKMRSGKRSPLVIFPLMPPEFTTAPAAPQMVQDTWREIDDVVQDIARLSRSAVPSERFFAAVLDGSVRTLAAVSGAVWLLKDSGFELEQQINLGHTGLVTSPDTASSPELVERQQRHQQLLQQLSQQTEPQSIAPRSGTGSYINPTDWLLLVSPIVVNGQTHGLIEVFQRPVASPAAVQGYTRFLTAIAEFAADFLRNYRLRDLQERASLWSQFERFTERVHEGLDLARIAAVIANDGRPLVDCDRISVAVLRGSKPRLIAVSGVDRIDRRSNAVRYCEDLLRRVLKTRRPFWFDDTQAATGQAPDLPKQIEESLHQHLNESHARLLAIIPLRQPINPQQKSDQQNVVLGAVLIEKFSATSDISQLRHRAEVLARQSELAVANALEYSNLPFRSVWRWIGHMGWYLRLRQLPRTLFVVGLLAAAVTSLIVVPADFTITGRAELQPAVRRGLFASSDGIVAKLSDKLATNQPPDVSQDEVLVELTNSTLDFELTRVTGELQTGRKRLSSTQAERLSMDRNDPRGRSKLEQLAAEEKELEETLKSLSAQLDVLKRQQAQLQLRSPINGQVLTWDATQLLQNRPVRQGDRLLEVADTKGEWILEVHVADQNIGHVRDAQRELSRELNVSFVVATDPNVVYQGRLKSVAADTRSDSELGPSVLVTVTLPRGEIAAEHLRPGATVIPHIHCGRRPVGYVWFHEFIHTIKTKLFF